MSIAALRTLRRSTPARSIIFAAIASGSRPDDLLGHLADRRAVRLHADRVDDRVGAAAVGQLAERLADVVVGRRRRAPRCRARARASSRSGTRSMPITSGAAVLGDARAHVADRAEAEDRDRAAVGDVRVLDRLPRGGQDVGEVDEAVVRRALGHLDRPVLGLRHAQELGLAAGHLAVELRVAEQRRALPWSVTWVVSHCDCSPWSHMKQWPQEMLNGITTRSPWRGW